MKKNKKTNFAWIAMTFMVAVFLTACGGGGSSDSAAPATNDLSAFSVDGLDGTIDSDAKTIGMPIQPFGTDVSAMVTTYTTNAAAVTINGELQVSGTTVNDFTNPITYSFISSDYTSTDYTVTVPVARDWDRNITEFSLNGVAGTIVGTTITQPVLPYGSDVTALVATFSTNTGLTTSVDVAGTVQVSGTTANDFTAPITYTVTAANSSTRDYTVTQPVAAASDKYFQTFSLNGTEGDIDEAAKTINFFLPAGSDITALVGIFSAIGSVDIGGTAQVSGTTANDFTSPVTYTVTAADASTVDYTVQVRVASASSTATPVAIADNATQAMSLTAAGGPSTLTNVTVLVNITHTYVGDLVLTLISPTGTSIILTAGNGGSGDNFTKTDFDDGAATAITSIGSGDAPFTGLYAPEETLATLAGEDSNGNWTLQVEDTVNGDQGTIDNFHLYLQ